MSLAIATCDITTTLNWPWHTYAATAAAESTSTSAVCNGFVALEYFEIEVELEQLETQMHELLKRQSILIKEKRLELG